MPKLIILVGNCGSGKSTYAKKLSKEGYNIVSRDSLRYMVNAGNYVFDREKEPIVHEMTIRCLYTLLSYMVDIVIDETNMTRKCRKKYIEMAQQFEYEIEAHVMPKISKEESVQRRLNSPHGNYGKEKWEEVWEIFDNRYVEPKEEEGFNKIVFVEGDYR